MPSPSPLVIESERLYMGRALELARRGRGRTSPNPMVGAVVVRDGRIIGEGWHERVGGPHAEVNALNNVEGSAAGATMYVTLEPCCHQGRTPPCAPRVIESGLSEVVVGIVDPHQKVRGQGIDQLRKAGLGVRMLEDGTLQYECARLNEVFIKYVTTGLPLVTMKYAMTLDGKIATRTGHSQWISGEASRQLVHEQRTLNDAVMVGIGTALADDPRLTARGTTGRDPVKVIVDSKARLPLDARVLDASSRVILAVTDAAPPDKLKALQGRGVQILACAAQDGRVDLHDLMIRLGKEQLTSVLIEGGGILLASAVEAGLVDKALIFIAPMLLGGAQAPTPLEGEGVAETSQGIRLHEVVWQSVGQDMLVHAYLRPPDEILAKAVIS